MEKIIKGLFLVMTFTCLQDCVQGDVFELKQYAGPLGTVNVTVNTPTDFRRFATVNMNALPIESIDYFAKIIDDDQSKKPRYSMLGYTAFFPTGVTGPQQVYVAQKQAFTKKDDTTDYSIADNADFFKHYTNFDHTERQLLGKIITDHNITADTEGNICVYTKSNPCQQRGEHNHNFHCIEYYNAIAAQFPHINFHVYFSANEMTLNTNFINDNPEAKSTLLDQLDTIAAQKRSPDLIRRRRVLQVKSTNGTWYTILESDHDYDSDASYGDEPPIQPTLRGVAAALNTSKNLGTALKECLFNRIHNTDNISNLFYHAI